ncbi:MAG: Lycopene cyclase [Anaerolineae bacterium]|nr:Lycopene cyclase [Anaerolineae bacterium]
MKEYDFVIAGGGVAGLSLAYHLIRSPLRNRSILIVDKNTKDRNDRTLSFWTDKPTLFDDIVCRSWRRLRVAGEGFDETIDLGDYRYDTIRGIDFYRFVQAALAEYPNVEFVQGTIDRIEDGGDRATVWVEDTPYAGKWVFDSLFNLAGFDPGAQYRNLQQCFKGWEIETVEKAFDPETPLFMDFRAPQQGELRFFYVLPFSATRALVECVFLSPEGYDRALKVYVENVLGIKGYRIVSKEAGISPLSDYPFPRRAGRRVMTIGTPGGMIKPTSGYAFLRMQEDSAAIVASLLRAGHPFDVPPAPAFFRFCDSMTLRLMARCGDWLKPLFITLFRHNPVARILRFQDEATSMWENLLILATLLPRLFLQFVPVERALQRLVTAAQGHGVSPQRPAKTSH